MTLVKQRSEKRRGFTAKQKLVMVDYAEKHGNRATARKFTIDESCVRSWRKMKHRLAELPENKMAERGSDPFYPELESVMIAFVKEKQYRCEILTFQDLRNQAKEIGKRLQLTSFKASADWVYGFMRRFKIKGSSG